MKRAVPSPLRPPRSVVPSLLLSLALPLCGCHLLLPYGGAGRDAGGDAAAGDALPGRDAAPDASPAAAPFTSVEVIAFSDQRAGEECSPSLTRDERVLYYEADTSASTPHGVELRRRASLLEPWLATTQQAVTWKGQGRIEPRAPHISLDGRWLYLTFQDPAIDTSFRNWVAPVSQDHTSWGTPVAIRLDQDPAGNLGMSMGPSGDDLHLAFSRDTAGGGDHDLYLASRDSADVSFGRAQELEALNAKGSSQIGAWLNKDGTVLYYSSAEGGDHDLFVATRPSTQVTFSTAQRVRGSGAIINTSDDETNPWLSPDLQRLYFCRDRGAGSVLYLAER